MTKAVVVVLVAAVLCVVAVTEAFGRGGGGKWKGGGRMRGMMRNKKCGDEEINVEAAFKGMKECRKELKNSSKGGEEEERTRRSPDPGKQGGGRGRGGGCKKGKRRGRNMCARVCMWKKQGVLDTDGKWNEGGAKEQIAKVYPEKVRADVLDKWEACASENSPKFSMDTNCGGYKDFNKCLRQAHMKVCGLRKGKDKESKRN